MQLERKLAIASRVLCPLIAQDRTDFSPQRRRPLDLPLPSRTMDSNAPLLGPAEPFPHQLL